MGEATLKGLSIEVAVSQNILLGPSEKPKGKKKGSLLKQADPNE